MSCECTCQCCQGSGACAAIGQPAPDFMMKTTADLDNLTSTASLTDYAGKWLVLFFYPLDFTFVCPTEITGISDAYDRFVELGADVLGVSTDSVYSHRAWINTPRGQNGIAGTRFPIGSDITKEVSRKYGVLLEKEGIALRGLFIIDPQGVLQYSVINNLNVGRSVEETIRVLQALQTGERCPMNWVPGQKTL
ncbi:MAG: peroxiredoxin [Armatimonadetes bacterium]|nr:peroxiredoxin [Armatimonadota bacterium]